MARLLLASKRSTKPWSPPPLEKLQVSIDELKVQWDSQGGYGQLRLG